MFDALAVGVAASIVASLLTFFIARAVDRGRQRRKYGHLLAIAEGHGIQIIVPDFPLSSFLVNGARVRIPPNVTVMPMAEGAAIADIVQTIRGLGRRDLVVRTQYAFQDSSALTITIGGPSVNRVTEQILKISFPKFRILYPQHVAMYGSTTYRPEMGADGALLEDYGFIASVRTKNGNKCILLLGVWAPGTLIAAEAFVHGARGDSKLGRIFESERNIVAVTHARLFGLEHGPVSLVGTWEESP